MDATLTPVMERFIMHWGEMGSRWGVNRSVAQVHGLLFLSPEPLTAEEIAETLGLSRSNVSISLKELQGWGLVHARRARGARRDELIAEKDPQKVFRLIVEGRKRREIDPTLTILRDLSLQASQEPEEPEHVKRQITRLLEFTELLNGFYEDVMRLSDETLLKMVRAGARIADIFGQRSGKEHQTDGG